MIDLDITRRPIIPRGKFRIYFHVAPTRLANVFHTNGFAVGPQQATQDGKFKMTMERAVSRESLANIQPLDFDDVAMTPSHLATTWVGTLT